jgi:hypothetical protein
MGGVYILGVSHGTSIIGNVIAHVSPFHMYGWSAAVDRARELWGHTHALMRLCSRPVFVPPLE